MKLHAPHAHLSPGHYTAHSAPPTSALSQRTTLWPSRALKRFWLSALCAVVLAGPGCTTTPRGPYSPSGESGRNPAKADALNQQAAEVIERDPVKAERLLREALTHDLFHGPAHNNLGTLLMQQGLLYEAAAEYEWARKLLPGHPDPRLNLGYTLELAGRTDEAIATYRTALEVYPDHLPSMQALSRLQVKAGRSDVDTPRMLKEVAMRGETAEWRSWAMFEMTREGR